MRTRSMTKAMATTQSPVSVGSPGSASDNDMAEQTQTSQNEIIETPLTPKSPMSEATTPISAGTPDSTLLDQEASVATPDNGVSPNKKRAHAASKNDTTPSKKRGYTTPESPNSPNKDWNSGNANTNEPIQDVNIKMEHNSDELDPFVDTMKDAPAFLDLTNPNDMKCLIWTKRRHAMCEALDYYKAYNSSLYTNDKIPYGFMVDGEVREEDVLQAQVIITTIGGGRVKDEDAKGMVMTRTADQPENSQVQSFKNALEQKKLIGIIGGNKHPAFADRTARYSVLDFFQVTDVWAEKKVFKDNTKPVRIWCVRLEKASLKTLSWWDKDFSHYALPSAEIKTQEKTCGTCGKASKHVLEGGWACLDHTCAKFFLDVNGNLITDGRYKQEFVNERHLFTGEIRSVFPQVEEPTAESHGSELPFRVGKVCPKCGCCSARKLWLGWTCENEDCDWEHETKMKPYPAALLKKEEDACRHKMSNSPVASAIANVLDRNIIHRDVPVGQHQTSLFWLPDKNNVLIGSVTVFRASEAIRNQGIHSLFDSMSTEDIGLQRNVVSCKNSSCEGWTRHYGQNFGAKYKFGVDVQSKGFEEAPDAVLACIKRLIWAAKKAVAMASEMMESHNLNAEAYLHHLNIIFNECLSLGYMQGDSIKYHTDGELTLGPTVATLSLGSPAWMAFRPKASSGIGRNVLEAKNCPQSLKEEGYDCTKGLKDTYREVLGFPLYHGDIVVMHGTNIHRDYEHTVVPQGDRRFALTCRYINPDTLEEPEREEALVKGAIPERAAQFEYDGDASLPPISGLVHTPGERAFLP